MADNKQDRSFQDNDPTHGKDTPPYANEPGQQMLGDETEEQNLGQPGDPSKRITEDEVKAAFSQQQGQQGQSGQQR